MKILNYFLDYILTFYFKITISLKDMYYGNNITQSKIQNIIFIEKLNNNNIIKKYDNNILLLNY